MHLSQGTTYAADVALTGLEAVFGAASAVKGKFAGLGFTAIDVHDLGGGKFHVQGIWGKPDADVDVPSQVKNIQTISAPGEAPRPDLAQQALDMAAAQAKAQEQASRASGPPAWLLLLGLLLLVRR
jgi:hypothetical protein